MANTSEKINQVGAEEKGNPNISPQDGDIVDGNSAPHDEVFGTMTEDGPNYRGLGWLGTVALMMKTQIGLGVLSLPKVFDLVGMVPGVLLLCIVAATATWTSCMVGVFKFQHREVYSMDDAGRLMFGKIGYFFFGVAFCLYWIFVAGSAMLGISIGLNAISSHATCTATFVAVAAILGFLLASIRTFGRISWLAWVGLTCILISIFIVTIAVGIQDRPASAPQEGPWSSDFEIIRTPTFTDGVRAVSLLTFACSATPAYFSLVAEMRDPQLFQRAVVVSQAGSTIVYLVIAVVVYYFCGSYVSSPALGSAGPLIKKIAYGLSLPGLFVTLAIDIHLTGKYIFLQLLRGTKHLNANTWVHWGTWLACTFGSTIVAYLIASGIPVFDGLVSLICALLSTVLAYQPTGCMWFYDNWNLPKAQRGSWWKLMVFWSAFIVVVGCFMTVAGTYGSIVGIIDSLNKSGGTKPWSCADNSSS
ncbi:unnamed protein product [Clonostachys rosea]|uniref:Amino acid transporter transmembrane domain-containing protein n=1 Tax=Bionectria ochroleuca TaxID=29856 RepID=A0ABY6TU31_BIOOC|nr:unnamed protein product [Clonostachys rosea]